MTSRHVDSLAKLFVDACFELHRRRLWSRLSGDALFLMRLPVEDAPVVANVMGQEGTEYGLMLVRSAGAFRHMARLILEPEREREHEQLGDSANLASFTFEPLGQIPSEFRALLRAGGHPGRRDELAPLAIVKPPYRQARPPRSADLRTLAWAALGVLAADDAGELRPTVLDGRRRRILELEVSGELRAPTVVARLVPWPEDPAASDVPALLALPPELESLPRLDELWFVSLVALPGAVVGDDGVPQAMLVGEENGQIIGHEVFTGEGLQPAAKALTRVFTGATGAGRRGLPREIVFGSERLFGALVPALAACGVEARLDTQAPGFREIAKSLFEAIDDLGDLGDLGDISDIGDPIGVDTRARGRASDGLPRTLEEWKRADRELVQHMMEEAGERRLVTSRAYARYFGSAERAAEVLAELGDIAPFPSFAEWLVADYRSNKRSATLVEELLRRGPVDPAERALLEARRDAAISVFRVDSTEPGAALHLEDVLTGERCTVHDRALSGCGLEGYFLPLRLLKTGEWVLPLFAGPPLAGFLAGTALHRLERDEAELTPTRLRASPHVLGRLWSHVLERRRHPPRLNNTDGDPLELHTATLRIADVAALSSALEARPDVEHDEESGRWTWLRRVDKNLGKSFGEAMVLGRFEILDDRLVLEVNSSSRLARARAWLEALPGVHFERASVHGLDPEELPLDDRLPGPPPESLPAEAAAEATAELEEGFREYCWRWLDEPLPILDELTPRAACSTAAGRRRVARLIRTMPAMMTPHGPIEAPREELLAELELADRP